MTEPVATVRIAVRRALSPLSPPAPDPLALVACSGGADSLALAAATGFVAPRLGWRAGLVTVDHGLQPGSADRATAVARWAKEAGLDPVVVVPVRVAGRPGGPEAAARDARYEALASAARESGAAAVLLGHTRDDQAETVLLALARGAGPRGLAGMPARRDRDGVAWLRPLLDVSRAQTRAACAVLGLDPWDDPHNADPAYARARVRATVLPALVKALGPRVIDNLARTARQLAADTAALDAIADTELAAARTVHGSLRVPALRELPDAIRTRVLHRWARELGVSGSALSHRHVAALDALITDWHGQGPVYLPGGLTVTRRGPDLLPAYPPAPA
ncbi:MAG TPA: tRNA lysidine(34) synthetase TilS [Natronosporangium sp.]